MGLGLDRQLIRCSGLSTGIIKIGTDDDDPVGNISTNDNITAVGTRISATEVLTLGVYTTTGLTAGSIYYVSETTGAITITKPTTSTSIVRVIAYALSTTELFVNPDVTWIENA